MCPQQFETQNMKIGRLIKKLLDFLHKSRGVLKDNVRPCKSDAIERSLNNWNETVCNLLFTLISTFFEVREQFLGRNSKF